MATLSLPHTDITTSRISYGCMKIGGDWNNSSINDHERAMARNAVYTAVEEGITLFDHADIYVRGKSEVIFGEMLVADPSLRDKIVLQSKCGIRFAGQPESHFPGRYDFSYDHIVGSTQGILQRLRASHLDILLLHRPDALIEPEEVARAFDHLYSSGKVRWFGVSNHNAAQIELLRRYVRQPLIINQVELSIMHRHLIEEGVLVNQAATGIAGASGTLDYCRTHDIQIQAWSPLAGGRLFRTDRGTPEALLRLMQDMASRYQIGIDGVALAWLMRHPANIQPVIGTLNPDRIRAAARASEVRLTREEWYQLFTAARGAAMP